MVTNKKHAADGKRAVALRRERRNGFRQVYLRAELDEWLASISDSLIRGQRDASRRVDLALWEYRRAIEKGLVSPPRLGSN